MLLTKVADSLQERRDGVDGDAVDKSSVGEFLSHDIGR